MPGPLTSLVNYCIDETRFRFYDHQSNLSPYSHDQRTVFLGYGCIHLTDKSSLIGCVQR